jgi:hypothetical protein
MARGAHRGSTRGCGRGRGRATGTRAGASSSSAGLDRLNRDNHINNSNSIGSSARSMTTGHGVRPTSGRPTGLSSFGQKFSLEGPLRKDMQPTIIELRTFVRGDPSGLVPGYRGKSLLSANFYTAFWRGNKCEPKSYPMRRWNQQFLEKLLRIYQVANATHRPGEDIREKAHSYMLWAFEHRKGQRGGPDTLIRDDIDVAIQRIEEDSAVDRRESVGRRDGN